MALYRVRPAVESLAFASPAHDVASLADEGAATLNIGAATFVDRQSDEAPDFAPHNGQQVWACSALGLTFLAATSPIGLQTLGTKSFSVGDYTFVRYVTYMDLLDRQRSFGAPVVLKATESMVGCTLFRLLPPHGVTGLYCSDQFRHAYERARLTGLVFGEADIDIGEQDAWL